MAFICTANFDDLTNGDNLANNTIGGGSGFTSNWGVSFTGPAAVDNAQSLSSPNSVKVTTNQTDRDFAAVSVGILYVACYSPGDGNLVWLRNGTGNFVLVRMTGTTLEYFDSSAWQNSGLTISTNTWTTIGIEIDETNQPGKARFNKDGGAFTSWFSRADTPTSCNKILLWGGSVYYDNITPPVTSAIKTIDGLAKASVKTVDGLVIASVKTWDGLA